MYNRNNNYQDSVTKQTDSDKLFILINDTYILGRKIGSGTFGQVYLGRHQHKGTKVAIKLEPLDNRNHILQHEYQVYKDIYNPNAGICKCHYFGLEDDYAVLVVDLLGKSLGSLFAKCGGSFSLKTVLMLADQMISRLEYLHENNYIHRDLKPDNMMIGRDHLNNQIFLIDYGLAKKYRDNNNRHISWKEGGKMVGTARYASLNSHKGYQLSRRDDMISLAYILIYFLKGRLPWQKVKGNSKDEKYNNISKLKGGLGSKTLCSDLPKEFKVFLDYCCGMEFTQVPDYNYLRNLFKSLFRREGFTYDLVFDWVVANEFQTS
jgi:casein kinase 1